MTPHNLQTEIHQSAPPAPYLDRFEFRRLLHVALMDAEDAGVHAGLVLLGYGPGTDREMLDQLIARIVPELAPSETLGRLDHDLAILIADLPDRAALGARIHRLREFLRNDGDNAPIPSFGAAMFPRHGEEPTALMHTADMALRRAREIGSGEIYVFERTLLEPSQPKDAALDQFRDALAGGQIMLHYQPQYEMGTGRVLAMEALTRWQKPDGIILPSREFLPKVIRSGLILPLGRHVIRLAARQARLWEEAGHDIKIAINVSAPEARQPGFLANLDLAVEEAGVPATRFEIEVNHAIFAQAELPEFRAFLNGLRERGIGIVWDDFGVGHSSARYLHGISIEKVKIDASFVAEAGGDDANALLEVMVGEGHRLARRVVAEGVETEPQLAILREARCDDAQGRLLMRSGPADVVAAAFSQVPSCMAVDRDG